MPIKGDQVKDRTGGKYNQEIDAKRGRQQRNQDPYVMDEGGPEPAICTTCQAVYRNKRWYTEPDDLAQLQQSADTHEVTCPACQKINERYPEGIVTLRGKFLWKHEEEIRNLLQNTENTAMAKNPLERIMGIESQGEEMIIETTEQKLAEHIGRALHRAYQGELDVKWGDSHQVCRVYWERDE